MKRQITRKPDPNTELLELIMKQYVATSAITVNGKRIEPTLNIWDDDFPGVSLWYGDVIVADKYYAIQIVVGHKQVWTAELFPDDEIGESFTIDKEWASIFLTANSIVSLLNEQWFSIMQQCGYE